MSTGTQILDAKSEAMPAKVSIVTAGAAMFGCSPERVYDLCRNFWPQTKGQAPLTNAECWTGLTLAVKYGLDPAAREIYVMRTKDRICCAIGIDGWIKILDATEGYDGFEQTLEFDEKGSPLWCETVIYTTRRNHPMKYRAYQSEYARMGGFVAEKMPLHMLRIFSLRHAARLFAPIGGNVVTEDEARWLQAYGAEPEAPKAKGLKDRVKAAAVEFQADPLEKTGTPANLPGESEASSPETTAGDARAASPAVSQRDPGDDDEPETDHARRLAALAKCSSLTEIRHWWKSFEDESNAGLISQAENIELVNAELKRKSEIEGRLLP